MSKTVSGISVSKKTVLFVDKQSCYWALPGNISSGLADYPVRVLLIRLVRCLDESDGRGINVGFRVKVVVAVKSFVFASGCAAGIKAKGLSNRSQFIKARSSMAATDTGRA